MFVGSIEDIVDSWGSAVLIPKPNTSYGDEIYSVIIGGVVINFNRHGEDVHKRLLALYHRKEDMRGLFPTPKVIYHWSCFGEPIKYETTFKHPRTVGDRSNNSTLTMSLRPSSMQKGV